MGGVEEDGGGEPYLARDLYVEWWSKEKKNIHLK